MRHQLLVSILSLAATTGAVGQVKMLQPGQRVRVTVPRLELENHEETFREVRGDMLVLESVWLPLREVSRLETPTGSGSQWALGAGLGGVVGVMVGGAVVGVACQSLGGGCSSEYAYGFLGGALVGVALGAAMGSLIRTESWEEVPLDRFRVSVTPTPRGLGIGARIAF